MFDYSQERLNKLPSNKRAKIEELIKRKAILEQQNYDEKLKLKDYKDRRGSFYFKPFKWQQRAIDLIKEKSIVIVPAPNKIGKSCMIANVAVSWCLGYEPWTMVDKDHPEAVRAEGKYYKRSSLGISPPVSIRITSEDWTHSIGQVLVPELKKWAPEGTYKTKKNTNSVEYLWTFKNKSNIEIMTHEQPDKIFESWLGHGWIPDEPPPEKKYAAMARGLFATGGKILMAITPLNEPWLLDELVLSGRNDVGVIDELSVLDNDIIKGHDDDLLVGLGLDDETIKEYYEILMGTEDRGKKAEKFLHEKVKFALHPEIIKLRLLKWIKDCPLDQRPTRLFGKFKSLVGRVLKDYNQDTHVVEKFKIPPDWPVTVQIDFHLKERQAISFYTVDPRGIWYVIDEIFENLSAKEIADEIIRRKTGNKWRLKKVFIDPLSKGDPSYIKNRAGTVEDSFTILKKALAPYGMTLDVGSKDKTSGVRNIETDLKGTNGIPTMYFFDSLQSADGSGNRGHCWEILRWTYDDDEKPRKKDDHFMECLYRNTLSGVKYRPPKHQDHRQVMGNLQPLRAGTGW